MLFRNTVPVCGLDEVISNIISQWTCSVSPKYLSLFHFFEHTYRYQYFNLVWDASNNYDIQPHLFLFFH